MKCWKCKNRFDEVITLTEYGNNRLGNKDEREYCESCFDEKFPKLHERTDNEKSSDKQAD